MLVAVPPAPAARPVARASWRYLERGRAHEVRVEYGAREAAMRIVELAAGGRVEQVLDVGQPWEARLALWLLEGRLALMGEYWRERPGAPGWARVRRPVGAPLPDPRANEVVHPATAPHFHHYHDARGGGDRLLAALRQPDGARCTVVRAVLDVANLHVGRIEVLHATLPDVLARSVVMREEMSLAQSGLGKLATRNDYARAFGPGCEDRAARLVEEVVSRVRDGDLERAPARIEDSDVYAEFLVRLHDARLLALHRRFLHAGEEDGLLAAGPVAIRKAVQHKRSEVDHREQHLLTILEASLLAREKMASGRLTRGDPEVRALTRLAYYL